jgi:hypothetical protein
LLIGCLFNNSRILISHQHNICISKRMSRLKMAQKLKIIPGLHETILIERKPIFLGG